MGFAVKPVLAIDAKATEHFLHKQGIGMLKHTDVAYLWVQDEIRSQRLRVRRVRSEENVADFGTKPLSKTVIAKNCLTLGYEWMASSGEALGFRFSSQLTTASTASNSSFPGSFSRKLCLSLHLF